MTLVKLSLSRMGSAASPSSGWGLVAEDLVGPSAGVDAEGWWEDDGPSTWTSVSGGRSAAVVDVDDVPSAGGADP